MWIHTTHSLSVAVSNQIQITRSQIAVASKLIEGSGVREIRRRRKKETQSELFQDFCLQTQHSPQYTSSCLGKSRSWHSTSWGARWIVTWIDVDFCLVIRGQRQHWQNVEWFIIRASVGTPSNARLMQDYASSMWGKQYFSFRIALSITSNHRRIRLSEIKAYWITQLGVSFILTSQARYPS